MFVSSFSVLSVFTWNRLPDCHLHSLHMMEELNVAICSKMINSVMVNNVLVSYAGSADERISLEDRCDVLGWDIGSESNLGANQGDGIVGLPSSCSNGPRSCFKLADDPKRCGSHTSFKRVFSRSCRRTTWMWWMWSPRLAFSNSCQRMMEAARKSLM